MIHYVADEETMLLPSAEAVLKDRLPELVARTTRQGPKRAAPHAGEMAAARAMRPG